MKRTKLWLIAGGAGLLATVVLAAAQEGSRTEPAAAPARFEVAIPTAQEVRAMLGAYGARVEENEKALSALKEELSATREQLAAALQSLSQERRQDLGMIGELLNGAKGASPAPEPGRFRIFDFGKAAPSRRSLHLPAGAFGEATLLTGVYAPTTGDPLPVLVRLETALVGPGRTRVPISGAYLVGRASGDANSKRAVVQLDTLSIVRRDGRAVDAKVNGWVVDDDGIQGLRGQYVWRADEIAALASLAGGLDAGAEALAARETTSSVTPLGGAIQAVTGDPLRFAGNRALGETARRFGEIVTARLGEVTPAIHVANGRRITVTFISGVTLDGMEVDDETAPARIDPALDGVR